MTLKEIHGGGAWTDWPESFRKRKKSLISKVMNEQFQIINRSKFIQFLFFRQWFSIKKYANESGIKIIGDIPLYVAHDSADVWSHQELFQLADSGKPIVVAGVPPDYFSPTGQLWGNPIFQWEEHKKNGFEWWIKRIDRQLDLVDIIRLDHFRGFAGYWEIPALESTAEHGRWVQGPGKEFFKSVLKNYSKKKPLPFIAEDLGEITQDVIELRDELNLPGMKVLQFAFSGPDNLFLPHHYINNCVIYTGTHDNDTTIGWFRKISEDEKTFLFNYLGIDGSNIAWDLIRSCWASVAKYAIAPMQDLLELDSSARMNYPSKMGGNWGWRMRNHTINVEIIDKLKNINNIYGRR